MGHSSLDEMRREGKAFHLACFPSLSCISCGRITSSGNPAISP